ncbi:uncharacterized protein [Aegilops tauschii subsp. strangulata]|uniref:uncharacterized protein n=1 Tax=Aegilops tauschii subsp. strangulata TaxID=200361 RepID=UPI001ABCC489|nr:uncharacterized protein LOC120968634 [Aegilops tauschii subsp. strangulata]
MSSSALAPAVLEALLGHRVVSLSERPAPRLTRLIRWIVVERSLWPVHVLLGAEATVADLARATVAAYAAEGCRPPATAPADDGATYAAARFELHLFNFKYALDALYPEEKVVDLGCRNSFLCATRSTRRSVHHHLLHRS